MTPFRPKPVLPGTSYRAFGYFPNAEYHGGPEMVRRYPSILLRERNLKRCRPAMTASWMLAVVLTCITCSARGQAFPIFNGTTNTCAGALLDSGGQGAGGYGNNENYTYTICPDAQELISLNFITFNLSTGGCRPDRPDGDLRRQLHRGPRSSGHGPAQACRVRWCPHRQAIPQTVDDLAVNNMVGVFAAAITCYQPCTRPTAVATHGTVRSVAHLPR